MNRSRRHLSHVGSDYLADGSVQLCNAAALETAWLLRKGRGFGEGILSRTLEQCASLSGTL